MVYICIAGCLIILLFTWLKTKNIIAPPFILSAIWLFMYIILLFRRKTIDLNNVYFSSFFIGLLFFVIGFSFAILNKNKRNCNTNSQRNSCNLKFNQFSIKMVIFVEIILFLVLLIKVFNYLSFNFSFNVWQSLRIGRDTGTYNEGFIIEYSRNAVVAFSIVCSLMYFNNQNNQNKKYFFISLIIASLFVFTAGNRGAMFMLILAIFFGNIIINNYSNKKVMLILSVLVLILLVIFIIFAFYKYVYADTSNVWQFIFLQLRIYFSTSTIAFVNWIESSHDYLYGANTFRFFSAILNAIAYDIEVVNTVQDFINVFGDRTNVYTILHYYASDFGLIYAFIIQFILGMIHGFLYKKSVLSKKINLFYIALQSIFYFPLINQFFDDKYFSILSTWIQYIFWFWLFTRKRFVIYEQDAK